MTASALEDSLNAIEGRVDELLAAFDEEDASTSNNAVTLECTQRHSGNASNQTDGASNSPSK